VQTAAYISAYAINVQQVSGLEPHRQNNRLGKFIRAYRDFLNEMQMWSARAVFDQKMGAIVRSASAGEGSQNEQSKLLIARSSGVDDSHEVTPTLGKQIQENGSAGNDQAKRRNDFALDDENGLLLMYYSHYLQRQEMQSKHNPRGSPSATAQEQAEPNK